jgi:UDP-4-amino-4,6-dideoxy-N-acetyl-beta-L-altrosamine N-acetyltransferase
MITVVLREITKCNLDQKKQVRDIRNIASVRRSMYNEHIIGPDEHSFWLERVKNDPTKIIFVVLIDEVVSGVVSLSALDLLHRKSDWAFYLDERTRGGLGKALEFSLINYAFNTLFLAKLNCEVLETNQAVVDLHQKFGFTVEGFRRSNIVKNGSRIGVHLLGLTSEDWRIKHDEIANSYKATFEKFNVVIDEPIENAGV